MRNSIFFFLLLIATSAYAQPVIQWQKTFGGSNWDFATSITKGGSGGFLISGTTMSDDGDVSGRHGNFDIWTVWMNETGALVKGRCYGGSFGDLSGTAMAAPGGQIQSGMSTSADGDLNLNHGDYDFWLFKTSETGDIEWQRSLGGSNVDQGRSVISAAGGGYIMAGNASSNDFDVSGNHGLDDYWIVKLNGTGSVEWQKSFGGSGTDKAVSIIPALDGGYAVAGSSASLDGDVTGNHGSQDYWIVKLSATGDIQWQRSLGGSDADEVTSIQLTPDGGYIVGGFTYSTSGDVSGNHGSADMWVVKLSSTGSIEWKRCYGGSAADQAIMVRPISGGYILLGSTLSSDGDVTFNHGNSDIWLAKLSSTGSIIWQKSYGGSMDDFASDIIEVAPEQYLLLGSVHSFDGDVTGAHGDMDYWVVKLKCNLACGTITGPGAVCEGGVIVLTDTVSGGTWSTSGPGATVTGGLVGGVSAGTITISYTVSNSCGTVSTTHEVTVNTTPIPVITISGNLLYAATGFTSYQWFKDGVPIAGATAIGYLVTSPGSYSVKVTTPSGCIGLSPNIPMTTASVAIMGSGPTIQVVPNPAKTSISVQGASITRTQVFNNVGALVLDSDKASDIPVGHLPAGIYYISVFDAGQQLLGRASFVKE